MTLDKKSKLDLIRAFSSLTLEKILQANYPTLGSLKRAYGDEKVETVVSIILHDLSSSFKGVFNESDVTELTAEIANTVYRNLSLEDVYMVCYQLKRSYLHGKLDQNKFLNAIDKHFNNRLEAIERKNYNEHLATKTTGDKRSGDPDKKAMKDAKKWYIDHLSKTGQLKPTTPHEQ
jgi:hypothetical protein